MADTNELQIKIPEDYFRLEDTVNYKNDIQLFFKKSLNKVITLTIEQGEKIHKEALKLFTGRDKLDFMLSQNPELRILMEKLGLDLMY